MTTETLTPPLVMPERLRTRPHDAEGAPIPFAASQDHRAAEECLKERLCGLCGQRLERTVYFLGGAVSTYTHLFETLPMHRECAFYGLKGYARHYAAESAARRVGVFQTQCLRATWDEDFHLADLIYVRRFQAVWWFDAEGRRLGTKP